MKTILNLRILALLTLLLSVSFSIQASTRETNSVLSTDIVPGQGNFQLYLLVSRTTPATGPGHVIFTVDKKPFESRYWSIEGRAEIINMSYNSLYFYNETSEMIILVETDQNIKAFTPYGNIKVISGGVGTKKMELKGTVKDFLSQTFAIGHIQL